MGVEIMVLIMQKNHNEQDVIVELLAMIRKEILQYQENVISLNKSLP